MVELLVLLNLVVQPEARILLIHDDPTYFISFFIAEGKVNYSRAMLTEHAVVNLLQLGTAIEHTHILEHVWVEIDVLSEYFKNKPYLPVLGVIAGRLNLHSFTELDHPHVAHHLLASPKRCFQEHVIIYLQSS